MRLEAKRSKTVAVVAKCLESVAERENLSKRSGAIARHIKCLLKSAKYLGCHL